MIKAFIFDLDGVITDTAEFHYLAWKQLADKLGWKFDREVNEALRGISRLDSIKVILQHNGLNRKYTMEQASNLANEKNELYVESLRHITAADYLPGARELLIELKNRNYKIALGSASKNAVIVLTYLDAMQYFDVIGDGTKVENSKPAPDVFLYAARELNVSPAECVVVEDAQSGVDAAIAGGFYSIGVGPADRVGHATVCYEAMDAIILNDVLAACETKG
jgi:beta-phosphoglucomutase